MGGKLYQKYNKEPPQNNIGNYLSPHSRRATIRALFKVQGFGLKFGEQGFCKEHHTGFGFTDKVRLKFIGFKQGTPHHGGRTPEPHTHTHPHTHAHTCTPR